MRDQTVEELASLSDIAADIANWFRQMEREGRSRCAWRAYCAFYYSSTIDLYLRNQWNGRKPTIANISIEPRGKGVFRELIAQIEYNMPNGFTIENVLNERLEAFLLRRGYRRTEIAGVPSLHYDGGEK